MLPFSLFYATSISFFAIVVAFLPLYCKDIGFSPLQIALFASAENLASLLGPLLVFKFAKVSINRNKLIIPCYVSAFLLFLPFLESTDFIVLTIFWFALLFFLRLGFVLVNSNAMEFSVLGKINYGRARVWGSIGFIAVTYIVGHLVDWYKEPSIIIVATLILLGNVVTSWLLSRSLTIRNPHTTESTIDKSQAIKGSGRLSSVVLLAAIIGLIYGSHAALYTYFSLHLQRMSWNTRAISLAWIIGVICEVFVFIFFENIERHIRLVTIFRLSIVCAALRWLILSATVSPEVILLSQILHAFSFGSFYVASVKLAHYLYPDGFKERGQAVMMAAGPGIGVFLGRIFSGIGAHYIDATEPFFPLFFGASIAAIIALALSFALTLNKVTNANASQVNNG